MSWTVPGRIKLTMTHHIEKDYEAGVIRSKVRETSYVVGRPDQGELRVSLNCGHCGREGVFAIQDLETTQRLRRGPVLRSSVAAAVLLASLVALWVIAFADDNSVLLITAFPATLILGPIGVALAINPSGNIGVKAPEMVLFDKDTRRKSPSHVTGNRRRDQGLACTARVDPA